MTTAISTEKASASEKPRSEFERIFGTHVFEGHQAERGRVGTIDEIVWKRPGSGFYRVTYHAWQGTLIVTGDVEPAMYQVTGPQQLEFWAACELSYFASKCVASPQGRGFRTWSDEVAEKKLLEIAAVVRAPFVEKYEGFKALGTKSEWHSWLERYGAKAIGREWMEYGDIGNSIDVGCLLHLEGLKRAIAQLKAKESAAA